MNQENLNFQQELQKVNEQQLPKVAKRYPFTVDLEPGVDYFYCTCGLSGNQPFCDGESCKDCVFKPIKINVNRKGKALLCGCKRNHPDSKYRCDGNHCLVNLDW